MNVARTFPPKCTVFDTPFTGSIPVTKKCHCVFLNMACRVAAWSDTVLGGLLILGSGLNERTRKQPAGEKKGDGPKDKAYEERIQRPA